MLHSPQRQTVFVIHQHLFGLPGFYTVILTDFGGFATILPSYRRAPVGFG
jgi:hypothetical protein